MKLKSKFLKINEESDILKHNLMELLKESPSFVRFFSPYCGWCTAMQKSWDDLENHFHSIQGNNKQDKDLNIIDINVGVLNHSDLNGNVFENAKQNGVPYILFIDEQKNIIDEYKGNRTVEDMVQFIKDVYKKTKVNNNKKQKGGKSSKVKKNKKSIKKMVNKKIKNVVRKSKRKAKQGAKKIVKQSKKIVYDIKKLAKKAINKSKKAIKKSKRNIKKLLKN